MADDARAVVAKTVTIVSTMGTKLMEFREESPGPAMFVTMLWAMYALWAMVYFRVRSSNKNSVATRA